MGVLQDVFGYTRTNVQKMYVLYMYTCTVHGKLKEALHVTDLNSGWSFPSSHTHCGLALKGTQRSGDYVETAIKTYMYMITYMCRSMQ